MSTSNTPEGTVIITEEEYDQLLKDSLFLTYLQAAGVDNWEGYDIAIDMMEEDFPKE